MKSLKTISILMLLLVVTSAFTLRKDDYKPVYVMGVSLCFGGWVVYFTDIQQIDSGRLTKEGFLPSSEGFSEQLKAYLEAKDGNINHTCITYFSEKKAALQKTVTKLMKRYRNGSTVIQQIAPSDFKFVRPEE